jgi:hypothetical protein
MYTGLTIQVISIILFFLGIMFSYYRNEPNVFSIWNRIKEPAQQITQPIRGGNGGNIEIYARKITGTGKIITNGGDGPIGGDAGKIKIVSEDVSDGLQLEAKGGNGN